MTHRLAGDPQHAPRLTKRALNQWLHLGEITSFDYSLALERLNFLSADVAAGVTGIREKRPAQFPSAHLTP